jgi:hypothetical protein
MFFYFMTIKPISQLRIAMGFKDFGKVPAFLRAKATFFRTRQRALRPCLVFVSKISPNLYKRWFPFFLSYVIMSVILLRIIAGMALIVT